MYTSARPAHRDLPQAGAVGFAPGHELTALHAIAFCIYPHVLLREAVQG